MPIFAKAAPSYKPAPDGSHAAVCCDVIDLGEIAGFGGKVQHKIEIAWQIDEPRDDGKRYVVKRRYTNSLHEKATLRKDLESWRGRAFSEEELRGFDLENLLSAPALINIVHQTRDGSTYANVAGIMKLPKGMIAITITDYIRKCDQPSNEDGHEAQPSYSGEITDDDVPF